MLCSRQIRKKTPNTACTRRVGVAAFSSVFVASGLYCSQAFSRPAHPRVTLTVGQFPVEDKRLKLHQPGTCKVYGIAV